MRDPWKSGAVDCAPLPPHVASRARQTRPEAARGEGHARDLFPVASRLSQGFPQRLQCAVQDAFDGVHRLADDPADVRWVQIFLITKGENEALHLRQGGDLLTHAAIEERIAHLGVHGQRSGVVERDHGPELRAARGVDAAARSHLPEPEAQMCGRLELVQRAIELEEDLLRDLLGACAVVEERQGDRVDHPLVLLDERRERVVVASLRSPQLTRFGHRGRHRSQSRHHDRYIRGKWEIDCKGETTGYGTSTPSLSSELAVNCSSMKSTNY